MIEKAMRRVYANIIPEKIKTNDGKTDNRIAFINKFFFQNNIHNIQYIKTKILLTIMYTVSPFEK